MRAVGVLAIQGDFEKHIKALSAAGAEVVTEVRAVEDLDRVDRLVIPGGESTTVGLLLQRFGLGEAIRARAIQGMPIWGTCMGMIVLAQDIEGKSQYSLGLLDITVRRNAFGAQVHSFEDTVRVEEIGDVEGVFIRAPIVTRAGPEVKVLATYRNHVVAVRQGHIVGTSFHPELTDDVRMHLWFLNL